MSIIRTHKQRSFAVIDHEPIEDTRLSWETLGLLTYLLSKPDNWTINADNLVGMERGAGRDKVYRMLKEMEDVGYLVRRRAHKPDGTFQWVRELYESPQIAAQTGVQDDLPTTETAAGSAQPSTSVPAFLISELAQVPVLADLFSPSEDVQPDTGQPDTGHPDTGHPDTGQPLTALPYMAEPDTAQPYTAKPDSLINTDIKIIIDLDAGPVGKQLPTPLRQAYEQTCGLIASPLLEQRMVAAAADYPHDWILRAIELAGAAGPGKNNWQYISGILANWKREGLAAQTKTTASHNGSGPPRKPGGRSPILQNDPNATEVTYTVIEL